MVKASRRHRAVTGYLILTVSVAIALAFATKAQHDTRHAVERLEHQAVQVEQARLERVQQLNRLNRAQCASLRNLYAVIRKALTDSDKAINRIGYYQQNPAERAEAHRRNRATIAKFRQPPCPPDVGLGDGGR